MFTGITRGFTRLPLAYSGKRTIFNTILKFQPQKLTNDQVKLDVTNHEDYKPPVTLDRELPDPFADKKKNRYYFVVYGIGVVVSCAIIFNYEKTRSPIINSTLYFLRRSSIAKEQLGEGINFASSWPWISGQLNTVQGKIDIEFQVKGSKRSGTLKLKAYRESKLVGFNVDHFILICDDTTYDLTKDPEYIFDL